MDLQALRSMGAIVPRTLFKREISFKRPELKPATEWADPESPETTGEMVEERMDVFIRRGSSADAIEIAQASNRERPFVAIFRSVCDEAGEAIFPTVEDAMQLAIWLAIPLFTAISEVSDTGPKPSKVRMNSGAKSRSRSGAARLPNGKKPSASTSKRSGNFTAPSVAP